MLEIGVEIALRVGYLKSERILSEIYLKFLGVDNIGIKMKGYLPSFWRKEKDEILGPELYNDRLVFKVVEVDYLKGNIWVKELALESVKDNSPKRKDLAYCTA